MNNTALDLVFPAVGGRSKQGNRIKEIKLDLSSVRTSCHTFLAN